MLIINIPKGEDTLADFTLHIEANLPDCQKLSSENANKVLLPSYTHTHIPSGRGKRTVCLANKSISLTQDCIIMI